MSDFVPTEIRDLSGAIPLMPISGYQNPAALTDPRKECFIRSADVGCDILFVDAVTDTTSSQLFHDFRAVPVFVKVER